MDEIEQLKRERDDALDKLKAAQDQLAEWHTFARTWQRLNERVQIAIALSERD